MRRTPRSTTKSRLPMWQKASSSTVLCSRLSLIVMA
nr:MAG TPA: hypothetical protein [Caudoviricetes sp.]